MEVSLWGVRGSIASPGLETTFYGGNTACIEVKTTAGGLFLFDAGSGLRQAGQELPASGECHLFLTHAHTDHIQGLGFFAPLHSPDWTTHLYLPVWLAHMPDAFFDQGLFPIPFTSFRGNVVRHTVMAGQQLHFEKEKATVEVLSANHPGGGLAYRLNADNAVFAYSGDHEIADAASRKTAEELLRNADIAVVDAMYDRARLIPGWGHSAWEDWLEAALKTNSHSTILLSHHAPDMADKELDALQSIATETVRQKTRTSTNSTGGAAELAAEQAEKQREVGEQDKEKYPQLLIAREGTRYTPPLSASITPLFSNWLELFLEELARYRDESTILDRILLKARELTNADAGTVFLAEQGDNGLDLIFAYTHNDSLFSVNSAHKYSYSTARIPVSESSIAGYAATTGRTLNLADVRAIPADAPYSFNTGFDASTGYVTRSMLTIPLFDHGGKLSGVLQLINSLNPADGSPIPFSPAKVRNVKGLAREAALVLERNAILRKSIYRILNMASVHDPVETGPHAERVGAIAAELYQRRADKLALDLDLARHEKGNLRLAAMLHDVGKVGIANDVLKKPGKLTDEEFYIMRNHTCLGASILEAEAEELMVLARDIALHHHQKWDGSGYAGPTDAGKLAGDSIPLAARITALADVFDALISPRCYKKPWTFDEAMNLLRRESGKHFDPFLVECMEDISDILTLIYERYPDICDTSPNEQDKQGEQADSPTAGS